VAVDGKDFCEEIGGVDQAGEEDKAEKVLAHPLLQPVETHVYQLGLLRANRRSRQTASTLLPLSAPSPASTASSVTPPHTETAAGFTGRLICS
jgi:hypothetical protein